MAAPPDPGAGVSAGAEAPILIVDDNHGKRLTINSVLAPLGQTIIEAPTGEQALREVMARDFAVVLMDVQMPGMSGYETAQLLRMRRESERTPIIFITAHARDEAQIPVAYANGAVDFIFGPIDAGTLRAKVSIFVELFLQSGRLGRTLEEVTTLSDQFRDSEARARAVLDNVADGIVTLGETGVIESFNRAATALFGYPELDAIGRRFAEMIELPDAIAATGAERTLQGDEVPPAASVGLRKDGTTFPLELELSEVELGARRIRIGCVRDISERQLHTEALQYQAMHDALTGLPNRVLFGDRLDHAIRASSRGGDPLALLVMDLDDFKEVNDTLGHQHGDVLLRLVAGRLTEALRKGDTVARLGGDEFAILPLAPTDLAGAAAVAWKVQRALEAPFLVEGHDIAVRSSIGIVLAPDHGDHSADLLRRADLAMYDAKRGGTGSAVFAAEQEEGPTRRLKLLNDLRHCIERDELVLAYQPKIDLATKRTIGVEALIRWNHPSGRLFMPDQFMPEVERNELIVPFTEWVVNEALRDLRHWRDEGFELTMAVNLGARCLAQGAQLFETVEEMTKFWDIPAERLTFELTEGALIDTSVPGLMNRLETMDERLSIDDFGTGYSSLVYLQRLPVVEIKADRSFVTSMATVGEDAVIVRSIIDLAHNLSLKVVAEGVEDETTMDLLIEYGCDEAQGYYFCRPAPADDLLGWLATSPFGCTRDPGVRPAATAIRA